MNPFSKIAKIKVLQNLLCVWKEVEEISLDVRLTEVNINQTGNGPRSR